MNHVLAPIIALLMACVPLCSTYAATSAQPQKTATTKKKSGKSTSKRKTATNKKTAASNQAKNTKPRTAAEVKQAKQRNAGELRKTRQQLKINTAETEKRLNQLNLLEGEIDECNANIKRFTHSVDSINAAIQVANDSIAALDNRLAAITEKYVKAIRRTQGHRQQMSELAFIFSSESFSQAYRRMRSLRQFAKWRKRKAEEITRIRTDIDSRRTQLTGMKQQASASLGKLNGEKASLVKKQGETGSLIDRLKQEGGELRQIMERRQREAKSLDDELDRIIAEEAARQERLRREREEAERKAREEEARIAAEQEAERLRIAEEKAAAEAEKKAEEARAAEKRAQAKAAEAERKARESADKAAKEKAKKEREAAKKAEQARIKAEKEAAKKAKEAEKQAAREKARKGKPVKHKGKNNGRGDTGEATQSPAASTNAPTLKAPIAAGSSGIAPKVETPLGNNFESYRGKLPFPVSGRYTIVKRFGRHKHPTLPHVETTNSGIDMQTAPGATVNAVFDGEVSAVFRPDGYNNVVVIRHGNYMTVYANLGSITVSTGQKVKAGESIGTVYTDANDGNRSILHFEIRNRRQKENPELWLKN